ncbi:MAG TPA: hypothetical protein VFH61_17785, partial [Thermoleophilia bacterium]|nr:hypothetical protein [Thermoleophilia bacterium]
WTINNDLDKGFVMKSCLVLADLPVACRVENEQARAAERGVVDAEIALRDRPSSPVEVSCLQGRRACLQRARVVGVNPLLPLERG